MKMLNRMWGGHISLNNMQENLSKIWLLKELIKMHIKIQLKRTTGQKFIAKQIASRMRIHDENKRMLNKNAKTQKTQTAWMKWE